MSGSRDERRGNEVRIGAFPAYLMGRFSDLWFDLSVVQHMANMSKGGGQVKDRMFGLCQNFITFHELPPFI